MSVEERETKRREAKRRDWLFDVLRETKAKIPGVDEVSALNPKVDQSEEITNGGTQ